MASDYVILQDGMAVGHGRSFIHDGKVTFVTQWKDSAGSTEEELTEAYLYNYGTRLTEGEKWLSSFGPSPSR